ncbi:glycosyltransferase family 4 protein [Dysgonomonas sp. 520]|uniref:glycosyltransferase family 4 protein n=1 Tax=Dysgonomonas sp. 520 TaxID=2302931 RepID=UPI0013D19403|nr:glycosyltransferase family 4 protein [Dysgonomonas sp. 520]
MAEIQQDVTLVVPEKVAEERIKQGWAIPDFDKVNVIVAPTTEDVDRLLNREDAFHIFSGINSHSLPSQIFEKAVKKKLKIGVILEPFNWLGWKGKLRFIKYLLLRLRYNSSIHFVLTIGNRGRWCYEKVGFTKNNIYDWAYFTENYNVVKIGEGLKSEIVKVIFIGSIDERKNILHLVDVILKLNNKKFSLDIIGKGPLENTLISKIDNCENIKYLGKISNEKIGSYISNSDILVLPSIFDGWGAVVNEALMCGTSVIASSNCGSSILLDGEKRGEVYFVEKENLDEIISRWLSKGVLTYSRRLEIKEWAETNISGKVAANYFIEIINHICDNTERPIAPWIKNKNK